MMPWFDGNMVCVDCGNEVPQDSRSEPLLTYCRCGKCGGRMEFRPNVYRDPSLAPDEGHIRH